MERKKILVVDDEKHIRLLLDEALTDEGYDVITISNAFNILEIIEREKPDLIILDIRLKNANGTEVSGLDILQDIRYQFYDLPIILCTAYDSFKGDPKAFAADYYVVKSWDFTELKKNIQRSFETTVFHEAKKVKEEKRERYTIWQDLSFAAAHKIGNPIFTLETDLQTLKGKIKDGTKNILGFFENMEQSLEKVKVILEQFKSLTKAQDISPCLVDIRQLLQESCQIASLKDVEVDIEVPDVLPEVMVDPEKIVECFDELIINSQYWFDKPEKKITVMVDKPLKEELPIELDKLQNYLRIYFIDNGSGVPFDVKEKIFEPFFSTKLNGTGLGLAIIQKIIEDHNGLIQEKGEPNVGSVFEIYLPMPMKAEQ